MFKKQPKENPVSSAFWNNIEESQNFKLQERKGTSYSIETSRNFFAKSLNTISNAVIGTMDSVMNNQNSPFRLIYIDPFNRKVYVLAATASIEEARSNWSKIIPIQKVADQIDDVRDKSMYYKGKLWIIDEDTEKKNTENKEEHKISINKESILKFKSIFNFPEKEELLEAYACTNIIKLPPRPGCMYLSKNHISFYSYFFGLKDIITFPFIYITDISKVPDMMYGDSISIKCSDKKEYRFGAFSDFVLAFVRITNTYSQSIGKMVESNVSATREVITTLISDNETQREINFDADLFNYKFRLPSDEIFDETLGIHFINLISDQYPSPGLSCQLIVTKNLVCIECKSNFFKLIIPMKNIIDLMYIFSNHTQKYLVVMLINDKTSYTISDISDAVCFVNKLNIRIKEIQKNYVENNEIYIQTGCFQEQVDSPDLTTAESNSASEKLFFENETKSKFYIDIKNITVDVIKGNFPMKFRRQLWVLMSGAAFEIELHKGYYSERVLASEKDEMGQRISDEIEKDLHRSLPEHPAFNTPEGQNSLRRVLLAYASYNPSVGYCQSMNIITAILLLYCTEEESFWILSKICERILPNYFSKSMGGAFSDKEALGELVQQYLPEMFETASKLAILTQLTCNWFLTLFLNAFTLNCGLHLFDCLFLFGESFLFQLSLGIIKYIVPKIDKLTEETEAVSVANYILKNKIKSVADHVNLPTNFPSASSNELIEDFSDIQISKLFYFSRSKFYSITNLSIKKLRMKSQHKAIIKLEGNAFNSVIRFVTRRLDMNEQKAQLLLNEFKEAHYKTKYWGEKNLDLEKLNSSWKTSIDYFLIDLESFCSLFDKIFKFGFALEQKEFSVRAFRLLSRKDRNNGLVDFSQFCTLFNIIDANNVELKTNLLYQMSFYNSNVETDQTKDSSANESVNSIIVSDDSSVEEAPSLNQVLHVKGKSSSSSMISQGNISDRTLTNIRTNDHLRPLTQKNFMEFWFLLQKLSAFEPFESNITESITTFASKALVGCSENTQNTSWRISYQTLNKILYSFQILLDLIDRRITINNFNG